MSTYERLETGEKLNPHLIHRETLSLQREVVHTQPMPRGDDADGVVEAN